MIRVTVELLPGGDPSRAESIGDMFVWRQHGAQQSISHYAAAVHIKDHYVRSVGGIAHRREDDVWALLRRVFDQGVPCPDCGKIHHHPSDVALPSPSSGMEQSGSSPAS